jgi:hypothetical protein
MSWYGHRCLCFVQLRLILALASWHASQVTHHLEPEKGKRAHTIEEKSRHSGCDVSCKFHIPFETWCGSVGEDRHPGLPLGMTGKGNGLNERSKGWGYGVYLLLESICSDRVW